MKITNAASHSKYSQTSQVLYAITTFLVADAGAGKLKDDYFKLPNWLKDLA